MAALRTAVERGLPVLAIGTDLFGAGAGAPLPYGEVFATVVEATSPLVRRTASEFAVVDALQPLAPAPGLDPVLTVSYRFAGRAALLSGRCGGGRVTVSGLGNTDQALACPPLVTVMRRALRPALPAGEGRPLGVGVVGYGRFGGMGYLHGTAAEAVDGLAFLAACDGDLDRRKAAEHDFPGIRVHATVEELAADDDVDVAVVATPPASHLELVVALLRAGRHVVCEKPLCFTSAEASLLRTEAVAAGRVLTVHQSRRWNRDFVALRQVVEGGELGQVFNVETFVGGFEHPCRAWHSEVSVSGGLAYDWGSHHLDWVLQLMGTTPSSVSAVGHKRVWHDVSNLDQLRIRLLWDDGREAEFLSSDVAAVRRPKFYVQGTAGTLVGHYRPVTFERLDPARGYLAETVHHAEAPADLTLLRYGSGAGLAETRVPASPEQAFAFHRNLADHMHLGDRLAVTAEAAGQVVALLEAASQSATSGGRPTACVPERVTGTGDAGLGGYRRHLGGRHQGRAARPTGQPDRPVGGGGQPGPGRGRAAAGVRLMEAYMTPFHPRSEALSRMLATGVLGHVRFARAAFTFPLHDAGNHRWRPEMGGGALLDLGVYCVSPLVTAGGGMPERLAARAALSPSGVDASFSGWLEFPSGMTAAFCASFEAPERQHLELVGTAATALVDTPFAGGADGTVLHLLHRDGRQEDVDAPSRDPYLGMVEHFAAVVAGGASPRRPPEDSAALLGLLDALRAAAG